MSLRRGAIGFKEVLFQSISFMAPTASVAFAMSQGARYSSGALPLSVILALVPCLTVAISLGQLARQMPSAGAFFTFPARALHPIVGFVAAWGYIFPTGITAGLIALLLGMQLNGALHPDPGAQAAALWLAATMLPLGAVFLLSLRGVRASAGTGLVLGAIELVVIVGISIALIIANSDAVSVEPFTIRAARAPGFVGMSGIIAGAVYVMLAFSGFESALPLAEEARDARSTISKAMIVSCLLGAAVLALGAFAAATAIGVEGMAGFGVDAEGSGWIPLAGRLWAPLSTVLLLVVLSSLFANQNAAFNALTRTWFAMGRGGILPRALATTHPRFESPYIAAIAQLVISMAICVLAIPFDAASVFALMSATGTALVIITYVVANLSCIAYFLRGPRAALRPWLHIGVPLVGIIAMLPVLCAALGIGAGLLPFVTPLEGPASHAGILLAIWMGLGGVFVLVLRLRFPERLAAAGSVLAAGDAP